MVVARDGIVIGMAKGGPKITEGCVSNTNMAVISSFSSSGLGKQAYWERLSESNLTLGGNPNSTVPNFTIIAPNATVTVPSSGGDTSWGDRFVGVAGRGSLERRDRRRRSGRCWRS